MICEKCGHTRVGSDDTLVIKSGKTIFCSCEGSPVKGTWMFK